MSESPSASWPRRWALLGAVTVPVTAGLVWAGVPAALLLGPLAAGVAVALVNRAPRVPRPAIALGQGMIGIQIAAGLDLGVLGEILNDWPVFLGGVLSVIGASAGLGWIMARRQTLPGTTALWGSAPGAASAMVVMAEAWGADSRLVAVMQFLRVILVALSASLVTGLWTSTTGAAAPAMDWLAPVAPWDLATTVAVLALGIGAARLTPLPAGSLLFPMILAVLVPACGLGPLALPPWLLAASYGAIGWSIGLRFTRPLMLTVAHALPRVIGAIVALMGICAGFAALLVPLAGVDPLTAYLATSPGGVNAVAVVAASGPVDLPFVMAMQMSRMLVVLLTGPALSRFLARRLEARAAGFVQRTNSP
ncbi:AbrB family transcriptional regulator [Pararhodospirillum oryzae]|uniref:Ammonia monooxygenase n=1 Tax=Pararhodospirillum oryzae TaxID=478448 RepID=A0A512HAT0_9PROT|nr:AbrB family transcriptional regulator [Pararhodospirillum oryzae]GEO82567.1 ammonia monooxygenase [Pararhodospirillum oryzae]